MLYLNFIRSLSVLFLIVGIATLPNLVQNVTSGDRYASAGTIDFLAAATSIANTGGAGWTACEAQDHCSGHGFCAQACSRWQAADGSEPGWAMQACGKGSAAGVEESAAELRCANVTTHCHCYPGYSGPSCAERIESGGTAAQASGKRIDGWCNVTYDLHAYWHPGLLAVASPVDRTARDAEVCSGHGWCHAVQTPKSSEVKVSFCQCDDGWFGETCELKVEDGPAALERPAGTSNNCEVEASGGLTQTLAVCPVTVDQFFISKLTMRCAVHGICLAAKPSPATGELAIPSGRWRPQTQGVCFCEPGFDGEQCLGGKQLQATQTAWTGLGSIAFVLGVVVLYRRRRSLQAQFDDDNVTPSDFTVFVQGLPTLSLGTPKVPSEDTSELYQLFDKIGPVHFIAPATNDAKLIELFTLRVRLLTQLQIGYEATQHGVLSASEPAADPRRASMASRSSLPWSNQASDGSAPTAAAGSVTSRMASGDEAGGSPSEPVAFDKRKPLECTPVTHEVSLEASRLPESSIAAGASCGWCIRLALEASVAAYCLCPRRLLLGYLASLDRAIDDEKNLAETYEYNRAFVTFSYADHKWKAVKAFEAARFARVKLRRSAIVSAARRISFRPDQTKLGIPRPPQGVPLPTRMPSEDDLGGEESVHPAKASRAEAKRIQPGALRQPLAGAESSKVHGPPVLNPLHPASSSSSPPSRASSAERRVSPPLLPPKKCCSDFRGCCAGWQTPRPSTQHEQRAARSMAERASLVAEAIDKQLPSAKDLMFRGRMLSVKPAPEPEEVIWSSLDSTPLSSIFRAAASSALVALLAFGGWYAVTSINDSRAGGLVGFFIAGAILALNWVASFAFRRASEFEQHHATGGKTRWIFIKVLVSQLAVSIAAAIVAVYGFPADGQNRYVQDWYSQAGAFVLRTVMVESVVPPILSMLTIPDHAKVLAVRLCCWKSATAVDLAQEPPHFFLAERSAGLMRTVIMAAALAPGMPVLSFFVSAGLFVRSMADAYCMQNVFQMNKSGPQLIRIMELTLLAAGGLNVLLARLILNRAAATSMMAESVFWLFVVFATWAGSGYVSWKSTRSRDCCCGTGHVLPWSRHWLCCNVPRLAAPFEFAHDFFMSMVFGYTFFERYEDSDSAMLDETHGVPYHELFAKHGLRRSPYLVFERILLFQDALRAVEDDLFVMRPMTGATFVAVQRHLKEILATSQLREAEMSVAESPALGPELLAGADPVPPLPSACAKAQPLAQDQSGDSGHRPPPSSARAPRLPSLNPLLSLSPSFEGQGGHGADSPESVQRRGKPDAPARPKPPPRKTAHLSTRASQVMAAGHRQAALAGLEQPAAPAASPERPSSARRRAHTVVSGFV